MSNNSNKFTTKDLYKELFHCRDFELQHLWQRSIFLAGFMVALFTLYGSFLGNRLNENEPIHGKEKIALYIYMHMCICYMKKERLTIVT